MKLLFIRRPVVAALFAAAGSLAVNCSAVEIAGNAINDSRTYGSAKSDISAKRTSK